MVIQRVFVSVFTDHLQESRDFWVGLLGFEVAFDSNWFVQLNAPGEALLEIGLIVRGHETIPKGYPQQPGGALITVVVPDVDHVHREAWSRGLDILEPPTDMFYGMRRMLLTSPAGQLVDVSSVLDRDPTQVEV